MATSNFDQHKWANRNEGNGKQGIGNRKRQWKRSPVHHSNSTAYRRVTEIFVDAQADLVSKLVQARLRPWDHYFKIC